MKGWAANRETATFTVGLTVASSILIEGPSRQFTAHRLTVLCQYPQRVPYPLLGSGGTPSAFPPNASKIVKRHQNYYRVSGVAYRQRIRTYVPVRTGRILACAKKTTTWEALRIWYTAAPHQNAGYLLNQPLNLSTRTIFYLLLKFPV